MLIDGCNYFMTASLCPITIVCDRGEENAAPQTASSSADMAEARTPRQVRLVQGHDASAWLTLCDLDILHSMVAMQSCCRPDKLRAGAVHDHKLN